MAVDLSRIRTIVIAMMENRSFDHLLGYLSLPENEHPKFDRIEGARQAADYYAHDPHPIRPITSSSITPDPPHERDDIDLQINALGGPMKGFVNSYRRKCPNAQVERVMEYCTRDRLITTDFLAHHFAICDEWFACIPASTLPNRLMAMSGYALVDRTPANYFDILVNLFYNQADDLLYDWLESRGVAWRVYYSGSFFFMQMPRIHLKYQADLQVKERFRSIDSLIDDFKRGDVPPVVFVEPRYQDDPRRGSAQATDDHPPASLWGGQRFLKIVYEAVTANDDIWSGLALAIAYDEHGSFFDHVRPPKIATVPPPEARYSKGFDTLGVRVPGIVVSPFVEPASVFEGLLDHTSILKFFGEKFGGGRYSPFVDPRQVKSLSEVFSQARLAPGAPISPPPRMT